MKKPRLIATMLLLITFTTPGFAQNVSEVKLEADQVVGGSSSTASGLGSFAFNLRQNALTYHIIVVGLDLDGMQTPADSSDDVTAIHFHNAPQGMNGPVVFGLISPKDDPDLVIDPVVVKTVSYFMVSAVIISRANSLVIKESFLQDVTSRQPAISNKQ